MTNQASTPTLDYLHNSATNNFFILAGPCVIEDDESPLRIAEKIAEVAA